MGRGEGGGFGMGNTSVTFQNHQELVKANSKLPRERGSDPFC